MANKVNNSFETLMLSKEFFEHLALEILKRHNFDKYQDLEFYGKNTTPDLKTKDNKIGVEVTRAHIENNVQISSYLAKYQGAKISDIPDRVLNDLWKAGWVLLVKENGVTGPCINNGFYKTEISDFEQIQTAVNAIQKKIELLNTSQTYTNCDNQELFVFLHKYLNLDGIKKIYYDITQIALRYNKMYSNIYILSDHYLYECKGNDYYFPYDIANILNQCYENAYKNSGMEQRSLELLKQQGHI